MLLRISIRDFSSSRSQVFHKGILVSMKISHISNSDGAGGAARAAYRLHRALVGKNIDSSMYVVKKVTDDFRVFGVQGAAERIDASLKYHAASFVAKAATADKKSFRSLAISGPGLVKKALSAGTDIINLHWIGSETLNLSELGNLSVPVVWRIADMWPFCGAEHYADVGPAERWRLGYDVTSPAPGTRFDIDAYVWKRKRKYISARTELVATTEFVAECIKGSALFNGFNVTVIPNALDTDVFKPCNKAFSREVLGLPKDAPIVLFGALGGASDPRKGWDLLAPALNKVALSIPNALGVVFGQSAPATSVNVGIDLRWMGHVTDDVALALLYSAADVMVVPSRQETFGQTASEAQACGCPVVAFNCTGLANVIEHGATGYLAAPYSIDDLAQGIISILSSTHDANVLSANARMRALRNWAFPVVASQYLDLYNNVLSKHKSLSQE